MDKPKQRNPTQRQIAKECARIRATWDSQRNHKARYGEDEHYERWEVPVIRVEDLPIVLLGDRE